METDICCFGSDDATPGSPVCVPVCALLGRVGRAGLPGALWCASPFLWPSCPSTLFGPLQAGVARAFGVFPPTFKLPLGAAAVSGFWCLPAPGALGLGDLCWLLPPPPPFFFIPASVPPVPFFRSFFLFYSLPHPLRGPWFCCPWCPGPWCFVVAPPPPIPAPPFFFLPCPSPRLPCLVFSFFSAPRCPGPRRFVSACPICPFPLSLFFFPVFPLFLGSVWCVRCVLELCPPPPGGSSCFAVSRVLLCGAAVCCGLFCVVRGLLRCFLVPCGVGVLLCGVSWCCVVCSGAGGLPWALLPLFLCWCCAVPCCARLFSAVFCRAWCRGALLCRVLCCVLFWCAVLPGRRVRHVVWGFPTSPSPLLLPPVAVAWSPVVARCCVLFWGVVLCWSVVLPVVWCAVVCFISCWCCPFASFALTAAVCCCLWLLGVRCWVWMPAVVFRWRSLARVALPARVACYPAVCFGLLWRTAPLCCVSCSVALCCRVVPCCGALLSVLLCYAVRVALCRSLAPPVVRCAVLLGVVFCARVLSPCAVLPRRLGAIWCLVSLSVFVGWSGCLVLFSGGACRPWCPCLASGRPPCCLVCWCGVLRCPAPCAVSCGAVLPCGAVLSGCVVRLFALLVFVFPSVLYASAKIPCCFSAPLKTF